MKTPSLSAGRWGLAVALVWSSLGFAQELKPVALPKPQVAGGRPLMQVLKDRKSSRAFSREKLSEQTLADLLWAADGVNRPETGQRTAPSARNWQEIDIYVATADAVYRYDAKAHALQPVLAGDIRARTGRQDFVSEAPLNLIYVADFSRMGSGSQEEKVLYSSAGAGCISQNVYLYCASEGLATVVRGLIDRPELARAMKLRADQRIVLAQTVGYPKQ